MKIVEIAFTGYPITDVKRARAFYEGVLRLEPTRIIENQNGHWIEYDLGASTFAISSMSKDEWKPSADGPAIAFEVEDFDSAVADLRENNAKFVIEPFDTPVCQMTIVADPDGNSICVHKRLVR
jgi:predicted enzyme related to lactoylglutathione lyase